MMQSGHRDLGPDTGGPRASRLLAHRHDIRRGRKMQRTRRAKSPGSPQLSTRYSVTAKRAFLTMLPMCLTRRNKRKSVAREQGRSRYGRRMPCVDPTLLKKRLRRYDTCILLLYIFSGDMVRAQTPSDRRANTPPAGSSEAEGDDAPALTWRRRKSSASLPIRTPPSSPPVDNADVHIWDEQSYAADNDIFQDRGSPLPPPSSTPIGVDSSSSRASVVPQSPQRADASDSDVVILSDGLLPSPRASDDNASDGSGTGSDEDIYGLDPRQYDALSRMMPKVAILKLIQGRQKPKPRRTIASRRDSDDERSDGGRPLRPGQSRILRRTASERADIEIRGDSESSDVEIVDAAPESSSSSSSSESDLERVVVRRPKHNKRVAGPSSQPLSVEDDTDSAEDEGIGQWNPEEPSRRTGNSGGGAVQERDIIDYMLTRTRPSRSKKSKKSISRRGRSGGGAKRSHTLHVVTSGTRRSGAGRQTTLAFGRASKSRSRSPVSDGPSKS